MFTEHDGIDKAACFEIAQCNKHTRAFNQRCTLYTCTRQKGIYKSVQIHENTHLHVISRLGPLISKKKRILAFSDLLPKSVISNNIQHHFTRLLIWRFTPFPLITVPATGPHPYFEMQRGPVDCNVINEPMKLNVLNRSVWSHRWYLNCEVAP